MDLTQLSSSSPSDLPSPLPGVRQGTTSDFPSLSLPEKITQITATIVRPIITLTFTTVIVVMTLNGHVDAKDVLLIYATLVAFWFGERSALKIPGQKNGE